VHAPTYERLVAAAAGPPPPLAPAEAARSPDSELEEAEAVTAAGVAAGDAAGRDGAGRRGEGLLAGVAWLRELLQGVGDKDPDEEVLAGTMHGGGEDGGRPAQAMGLADPEGMVAEVRLGDAGEVTVMKVMGQPATLIDVYACLRAGGVLQIRQPGTEGVLKVRQSGTGGVLLQVRQPGRSFS
jgi:hypothetical protein